MTVEPSTTVGCGATENDKPDVDNDEGSEVLAAVIVTLAGGPDFM